MRSILDETKLNFLWDRETYTLSRNVSFFLVVTNNKRYDIVSFEAHNGKTKQKKNHQKIGKNNKELFSQRLIFLSKWEASIHSIWIIDMKVMKFLIL